MGAQLELLWKLSWITTGIEGSLNFNRKGESQIDNVSGLSLYTFCYKAGGYGCYDWKAIHSLYIVDRYQYC